MQMPDDQTTETNAKHTETTTEAKRGSFVTPSSVKFEEALQQISRLKRFHRADFPSTLGMQNNH